MPKRILCIDDDPFYKDLFRAILEPRGYEVFTALNPAEGWSIASEHKPDLITLDVMMPEKEGMFDGYGLLKRLQEEPGYKDVPVIMISALGDPEDIQHGLKAGARMYLPKQDMTPNRLVEEIKKILGQ
ncbi:MAG: response regulator [Patescibacteria group bacterium]|nr:response regulator [Patescibacteria group bacterium]